MAISERVYIKAASGDVGPAIPIVPTFLYSLLVLRVTAFMAQELQGYNYNWTEADTAALCQVAPYTRDPQLHRHYPCQWWTGHGVCNALVQCCGFSDHLRFYHGVAGSEKAQVECCWGGCSSVMRKESLMRHLNEIHLEVKVACHICGEQFTRSHTLKGHLRREHSM